MRSKILLLIVLTACGLQNEDSPKQTAKQPTQTPVIIQPGTERGHHLHNEQGEPFEYLYREMIQTPLGMAWGPDDDCLYIADYLGRHIVKISPKGEMEEVGLGLWEEDGPRDLVFDTDGSLYTSDHSKIYRIYSDGSAEKIPIYNPRSPSGGIAFSADNELYVADRFSNNILLLEKSGISTLIATGIQFPENPVFGPDGRLYVTEMGNDTIKAVDVDTGEVSTFFQKNIGGAPIYMDFDKDGNLWVRGENHLYRINPAGEEMPINIDGTEYSGQLPPGEVIGQTAGGILVDPSGNVWIGTYAARIERLDLKADGSFTHQMVNPGYESQTIAIGPDDMVYTYNNNTSEIWRIDPTTKEVETIYSEPHIKELALKEDGSVYIGGQGEIGKLDSAGNYHELVKAVTISMTFGGDGMGNSGPVGRKQMDVVGG